MQRHKQTVHVKDRQRVDQHIAPTVRPSGRRPAPVVLEHHGVGQQVAVREHRALAAPGGAAGVEDGGQIVGLPGRRRVAVAAMGGALEQAAGAVFVQGEHGLRTGLEGNLADPAEVLCAAHHHRRFGVADEIFDLGALVRGVQRQKHVPGAQGGQVEHRGLDRFLHLHRDARSRRQRKPFEQVGDHGGGAVEVAPRIPQAAAVVFDGFNRNAIEIGGERVAQGHEQIGGIGGVGAVGGFGRTWHERWQRCVGKPGGSRTCKELKTPAGVFQETP